MKQVSEATTQAERAIARGTMMEVPGVDYVPKIVPVDVTPINLYKAMHKARAEMQVISKSRVNREQGYKYASIADDLEAIQEALNNNGLLVFNDVVETEYLDTRTTRNGHTEYPCRVKLRTTCVHVNSGESMCVYSRGEGQDNRDKAYYKAVTGARKFCLRNLFNLATDDDPELEPKHSHLDERVPQDQPAQQQAKRPPAKPPAAKPASPPDDPAELEKAKLQIRGLPLEKALAIIDVAESVELLEFAVDGLVGGAIYKTLPDWAQVIAAVRERYGKLTTAADNKKYTDFLAKMKGHSDKWKLDQAAVETFQPEPTKEEAPQA